MCRFGFSFFWERYLITILGDLQTSLRNLNLLFVCTIEKCFLLEVNFGADCYQELVLYTLIIIVFGLDNHSLISTDTCVIQISLKERKEKCHWISNATVTQK